MQHSDFLNQRHNQIKEKRRLLAKQGRRHYSKPIFIPSGGIDANTALAVLKRYNSRELRELARQGKMPAKVNEFYVSSHHKPILKKGIGNEKGRVNITATEITKRLVIPELMRAISVNKYPAAGITALRQLLKIRKKIIPGIKNTLDPEIGLYFIKLTNEMKSEELATQALKTIGDKSLEMKMKLHENNNTGRTKSDIFENIPSILWGFYQLYPLSLANKVALISDAKKSIETRKKALQEIKNHPKRKYYGITQASILKETQDLQRHLVMFAKKNNLFTSDLAE
ncbi:MAG: hypothetical protein WCI04_04795 [archaeon]